MVQLVGLYSSHFTQNPYQYQYQCTKSVSKYNTIQNIIFYTTITLVQCDVSALK